MHKHLGKLKSREKKKEQRVIFQKKGADREKRTVAKKKGGDRTWGASSAFTEESPS